MSNPYGYELQGEDADEQRAQRITHFEANMDDYTQCLCGEIYHRAEKEGRKIVEDGMCSECEATLTP